MLSGVGKHLRFCGRAYSSVSTSATSADVEGQRSTREDEPDVPKVSPCWQGVAPLDDYSQFLSAEDVQQWPQGRFRHERVLQNAPRNKGRVHWMFDAASNADVAVKVMPNDWVCRCHAEFLACHATELERPWVDIGCSAFLNSIAYPYACPLVGIYRSAESTHVVSELAPGGDLYRWSLNCQEPPGGAREAMWLPVAWQVLDALRYLHELSIVHHDVSLENILLMQHAQGRELQVRLVDFGMATSRRFARHLGQGKPSYRAPELHTEDTCDGFLSDAFAAGVVLYTVFMSEYPWFATRPGGCKAFGFFRACGLRALADRHGRRAAAPAQGMSQPLIQLLTGLLAIDPANRLTLGESAWLNHGMRSSVWDQPVLVNGSLHSSSAPALWRALSIQSGP